TEGTGHLERAGDDLRELDRRGRAQVCQVARFAVVLDDPRDAFVYAREDAFFGDLASHLADLLDAPSGDELERRLARLRHRFLRFTGYAERNLFEAEAQDVTDAV